MLTDSLIRSSIGADEHQQPADSYQLLCQHCHLCHEGLQVSPGSTKSNDDIQFFNQAFLTFSVPNEIIPLIWEIMILHHLIHCCSYDHDVLYVPLFLLLACKILHCVQYVLRKSVSIYIFQLSYKSCPLCPTDSWLPLYNYITQVTSFSPKYIIRFSVTSSVGNLFELWNTGKKNYEMRV